MRVAVEACAKATGRSISAISRDYYGQSGFLAQFIAGKTTMQIKKYDEVMGKIRDGMASRPIQINGRQGAKDNK
jgi:hypothetical protein